MNQKLINTIQWSAFIVVLSVSVLGILLPALVLMLQPTLFPNADVSGFSTSMQNMGIVVSFFSAILGVVSVLQALKSSKETNQALSAIQTDVNTVRQEQSTFINAYLHNPNIGYGKDSPPPKLLWTPDDTKS